MVYFSTDLMPCVRLLRSCTKSAIQRVVCKSGVSRQELIGLWSCQAWVHQIHTWLWLVLRCHSLPKHDIYHLNHAIIQVHLCHWM